MDSEWAMKKQDPTRPSVTVVPAVPERVVPYMSTVFAHLVDSRLSQVEQGFYCSTCLHTKDEQELFTRISFFEHLKGCRIEPFEENWEFRSSGGRHPLQLDLESSGCD
jgi:hypothetical protein